ncbi:MAG: dihydropteroate synthase [Bacteroidetes bacterium]|nr:MAG: dihydropteroate synthase [Bacteroidota bacterium]
MQELATAETLNCKGKLLDLSVPAVMGILNITPDSFYDGGVLSTPDTVLRQAEHMLNTGAAILDIGGVSSRPGAVDVSENEEEKRVLPAIEMVCRHFPEAIISVDTWRAGIAQKALDAGAVMINDISSGKYDSQMYSLVAAGSGIPYVLMHMQGTPQTMQKEPAYRDVVQEVLDFFILEVGRLRALGVRDIVLDPGFGFGKTVEHNFQLLQHLEVFSKVLQLPVLAGISRKSMICKTLGVKPKDALNGTTALHMVALQHGARILRVHDVPEAVEVLRLWQELKK